MEELIEKYARSKGADLIGFADISGFDSQQNLGFPRAVVVGFSLDPKKFRRRNLPPKK